MSIKYFAYGSNMCSSRLHKYEVESSGPGIPAKLSGYGLVLNKKSKDDSGKANIEIIPDRTVWGVLFDVSNEGFARLLDREKGYHRQSISIQLLNGTQIDAVTLIADKVQDNILPFTWYKDLLVQGALEHNLPGAYISMLRSIEAKEDPDPVRSKKMREILSKKVEA